MPPISAADLTTLRSQSPYQAVVKWYLAIAPYGDAVWTAQVNDPGGTIDDPNMDIPYDGASGSVEAGMTIWIGSTAGARDVGKIRVRADASGASGTLDVAENYDIEWADDLYLTAPGEDGFREIWSKYQRLEDDGSYYKDYDIVYASAGDTGAPGENIKPKANAGPPCVAWLNDSGYVDVDFVADESDVFGSGETITGYSWDFGDGAVQSWGDADHMGTEGSPNVVRFSSTGFRYVKLTVTCSSGETGVTYIPVWTFDEGTVDPVTSVDVLDQTGSVNNGWSATIRVRDTDNDTIYDIPDGALVVLFTKTEIDGSEVSIGGYHDRNNIRMVGWVDEETFVFDHETGYVEFQILGHGGKMRRCYGMGFSLETSADPTAEDYDAWYYATDLNVDRAIQWFLEWHTTVNQVAHVNKRGEGANKSFTRWICAETNLYEQVRTELAADATYQFLADRQGVFHVTTNPQFLPVVSRDTSICTLQQGDWRNDIDARRQPKRIGWVKIGGFNDDTPLLSWAPGDAPGYAAGEIDREGFIVESQTQLNLWSGFMLANENNPYPEVTVELDGYWPVFDHAFQEWLSLSADDPLDRNDWSLERFLIRGVSYRDLSEEGTTVTELTLEKSTTGPAGITKEVPELPTIEWPTPPPPAPPPTPPPPTPTWPEEPAMAMAWTKDQVAWCENILASGGPTWVKVGSTDDGDFNGNILGLYLVQTDSTNVAAWVVTTQGVYYTDSVMDSADIISAGWTGKLDIAWVHANMTQDTWPVHYTDTIFANAAILSTDPDYLIVGLDHGGGFRYNTYPAYDGGFVHTTDRGASWTIASMPSDNASLLGGGHTNVGLLGRGTAIDQDSGRIVAFRHGGIHDDHALLVYSDDGGVSFTFDGDENGYLFANADYSGNYGQGTTIVPLLDATKAYYYTCRYYATDSLLPGTSAVPGNFYADGINGILPSGYNPRHCDGCAPHVFNANIIAAVLEVTATGNVVLMRSDDGGSSWYEIGDASSIFSENEHGYVVNWPGDEDMWFWACEDPQDPTVGDAEESRMAYTDDGTTWNDLMGNWYDIFDDWGGDYPGIALLQRVGENAVDE